jgi:ubiquinone/menaquinone biosynthesis C-methylase UbiE
MMTLHPLAARFAEVADAYERGRPDYPLAVVEAIASELRLPAGARVLDLAAGTGKLTRALLSGGLDVIAVEPQEELRERLAANVGANRVHQGVAEAIPLPDASVAAVTVADAFHWFDHSAALPEIARVLHPREGGLVVLTTLPDWSGTSWAHEVGQLMVQSRPSHPWFDGPPWQQAVRAAGGWEEPYETLLTVAQPSSPDQLLDYLSSISWIAALAQPQRDELLAHISTLIRTGETPSQLPLHITVGVARRRWPPPLSAPADGARLKGHPGPT